MDQSYFINHPIFIKYKNRKSLFGRKKGRSLKTVSINERIIEIPLAIEWVSRLPRGSEILDLGCAESALPLFLAGLGHRMTGCDFRPYPYTHPNFNFVRGDILQLPLSDENYDAVLCISTIEHVGMGFYNDPLLTEKADKMAILEIYRVLKKGGCFILSTPYGAGEPNNHQRIYDELSLARLLQNFTVEENRYFKNPSQEKISGQSWVEIGQAEAAEIKSDAASRCICMVRAKK